MLKKDLAEKADISTTSIAKLGKNENVNTDILLKICNALECDLQDIMELTEDQMEVCSMDAMSVLENSYYVINKNFGFYKRNFGHIYYLSVKDDETKSIDKMFGKVENKL